MGTAQGQQLNVMAASLLDQNSRSLFHKQRVRAFFSLKFFHRKLQRSQLARRRLDGWSAESRRSLKGLGGNFSGCFAFLSSTWRPADCVPRANYFVLGLNLSLPLLPQIPADTQVLDHCVVYNLPPRSISRNPLRSFTFKANHYLGFSNVHSLYNINVACKGPLRSSSSTTKITCQGAPRPWTITHHFAINDS